MSKTWFFMGIFSIITAPIVWGSDKIDRPSAFIWLIGSIIVLYNLIFHTPGF